MIARDARDCVRRENDRVHAHPRSIHFTHLHELRLGVVRVEQGRAAGGALLQPRALLRGREDVRHALGVLGLMVCASGFERSFVRGVVGSGA